MAVSLPQEVLLFHVLTWVPAKSVIRFKCVSKQWNLFLMSDRFKQMHNRNLKKDPCLEEQNLFFWDSGTAATSLPKKTKKTAATFFTIDCESPPDNAPCQRPLPQFGASSMSMLTSYHGLVCLHITKNDPRYPNDPRYSDSSIILWNPLTTEYKMLSKPSNPDHMECYKYSGRGYGLYYGSWEDDYKLVVVTKSCNVYIYSLKSDSWRKLDKKAPFLEDTDYLRVPGLFCKNNLYFLVLDPPQTWFDPPRTAIRFDTTAKRFHKIKNAPVFDDIDYDPYRTVITVHKGSIHLLCVMYDIIELWKLIEDGDIWSKVVTYQLMMPRWSPMHLMSNGNLLMIDYRDGGRICQVDLKKKKYTDKDGQKSKGKNKSKRNYHDKYNTLLYYSDVRVGRPSPQEFRYTETFVSPNQYMK